MASIERVEVLMVDLPTKVSRSDAMQAFLSQQTPIVRIFADDGSMGTGYSYTIGTGDHAVVDLIGRDLAPRLIGRDPIAVESIWRELFFYTHATSVAARCDRRRADANRSRQGGSHFGARSWHRVGLGGDRSDAEPRRRLRAGPVRSTAACGPLGISLAAPVTRATAFGCSADSRSCSAVSRLVVTSGPARGRPAQYSYGASASWTNRIPWPGLSGSTKWPSRTESGSCR